MNTKGWREEVKRLGDSALKEFESRLASFSPFDYRVQEYSASLDKFRWLYRVPEEVFLLEKILSLRLKKKIEPSLSPRVFSYRKGTGSLDAVRSFWKWGQKALRRQPRKGQGIYVLRFDVKSYTDEIPLDERSPLWRQVENLGFGEKDLQFIKSLTRPVVEADDLGGERCRWRGIPTGSPLTPQLANLYLSCFDEWVTSHHEVFYARYGDDMIIAHSDRAVALSIYQQSTERLRELRLGLHPEKSYGIFWCPSGTSHHADDFFKPAVNVDYLGVQLHASTGIRLNTEKMRVLRNGWIRQLSRTLELLSKLEEPLDPGVKNTILVEAANRYFSPQYLQSQTYLADFYSWVEDAGQLHELEDFVARTLTQAMAGVRGTRAYRQVSWKQLIQQYGWQSPRHYWYLKRSNRNQHAP
ncbi:MAG: hypothetical protein KGQ59_03835 [Bdellovibrionales bacterium]|nr:hypothetical protein [Bdellovibrionales bacterium]